MTSALPVPLKPILVLGAIALTLAGCGKSEHSRQTASEAAPLTVRGINTETISATDSPETVEVVGTVRARISAVVSPRIPGTVSALKVREGDRVRKGQLLLQLDAPENQANAAQASAGLDEAQRAMDEALSRKKLADTTYDRYQRLFSEQAVSRQEFDIKQSEREQAHLALARAEARVRQAREGARAATSISDYTRIMAPVAGIVTTRQVDLGASVFPAQPLLTIEDDGSYQLELALPESLASRVRPGTTLQTTIDALSSTFNARIAEIVPAAEPGNRTITAKVLLDQKGLKSGMFGRASLMVGAGIKVVSVPKAAVSERGALSFVWVIEKDNSARMRLVKTGKSNGGRIDILSGLSAGERIATNGLDKIVEGTKVEP